MPDESLDRSYRALLGVPRLTRVVGSMGLARIGQSMVGVALVLFALAVYDSPSLAGIVTFASVVPGLLIAPIAGALLDRHGRVRLMILDYVVATVSLGLIGVLALAGLLPVQLLVLIVVITSLTSILSIVGLRTIFPIMVPSHLWERVNAVDSNGYVVATILGPPLAASLVAIVGAPGALIGIAIPFGLAALVLIGMPEPETESASTGRLLADAWAGVRYAWGNRTIRGLGFALSILNLGWGVMTIVLPLVVLRTLHYGDAVVGFVYAASGGSGMVSAFLFGRMDTRGREWPMLVIPIALMTPLVALLFPAAGLLGPIAPEAGLACLVAMMFLFGLLNGATDIALFTVRQRRTDPAWMGRAFAVSMAFNFMGFPVGAAIAGALVSVSMTATIWFGVVACAIAAIAAAVLVPVRETTEVGLLLPGPEPASSPGAAEPVSPAGAVEPANPPAVVEPADPPSPA
jgi:MFS family permease